MCRIAPRLAILCLLMRFGVHGATPHVMLDRSGDLSWSLPFSSGQLIIASTTNLTGPWAPYSAMVLSESTGSMWLPFTNQSQLYQVFVVDSASGPPGMRLVPSGDFLMGDDNPATYPNEKPRRAVRVSAFLVDQFEVTNQQMRDMLQWAYGLGRISVDLSRMASISALFGEVQPLVQCKGLVDSTAHSQVTFTNGVFGIEEGKTNHPCVGISWYGAAAYCNWRSEREGLEQCFSLTNWTCDFNRSGYRLPTEAEWEKAARGGFTGQHYPWLSPMVPGVTWTSYITTNFATYTPVGLPHPFRTTAVGYYNGTQLPPGPDTMNGYGLYDVVGNVREWCWDWYRSNYYSSVEATFDDPVGPIAGDVISWNGGSGPTRVTRGGSFDENQKNVRCAFRGQPYQSAPRFAHWYHGMRCVRRP